MIRLYALIVVIGLVGGAISGGYYYYVETQSRIQALIENTAKLTIAKKLQDETINSMVADQKKFAKLNTDLRGQLDKANDYKDVLIGKLRKHNLSKLIERNIPVQKRPRPLSLNNIHFYVVTQNNYVSFSQRFQKENGDGLVFYAVSVRDYETLSLNMSEIKRFLAQQKAILVYYEKAVAPKESK